MSNLIPVRLTHKPFWLPCHHARVNVKPTIGRRSAKCHVCRTIYPVTVRPGLVQDGQVVVEFGPAVGPQSSGGSSAHPSVPQSARADA